jgi:predicted RNA-binding Zn-ribbon protein involved in translation (DUF1610 family)
MKAVDLTDQRFGSLVAVKTVQHGKKPHNAHWLCKCDCGAMLIVRSDNLKLGHSTKCSNCGGTAESVFCERGETDGVV